MPDKYRVRTHHWTDGSLTVMDQWFAELEEAVAFSKNSNAHHAKIYNHENTIIDKIMPIPAAASILTYA
jgi:hypothetical protein